MPKKKPLAASYGVGRGGIVFIRGGGPQACIPAGNQFSVSVSSLCCESVSVSVSVSECRLEWAAGVRRAVW